jgi:hypothetical protein
MRNLPGLAALRPGILTAAFLEIKPMKASTEKAIKCLAEKITGDIKAGDAMQFAQAALNLAHVIATIDNLRGTTPR